MPPKTTLHSIFVIINLQLTVQREVLESGDQRMLLSMSIGTRDPLHEIITGFKS
jgi:hypothetical protein